MLHSLQFAIPILLALSLVAYGGLLAQCELPAERITRIAMWSLAGTAVISSFAAWEMYLHLIEGDPFVESLHELLLGGSEGAIVGGVIGYYDARRLEQLQETKQAQQAISASNDGIAILDEDECYTEVNQAHADAYGYEDPEDFLGESWRMCYTDAELERIEKEVYPELMAEGHWRGELTGLRRNGDTYPQELSLTMMDDGGLVCVVRDISDRKAQIQDLERAETLVETIVDGLYITDSDGEFDFVNEELTALTGCDQGYLVGEHFSTLTPSDEMELSRKQRADLEANPDQTKTLEFTLSTATGESVPVEIRFTALAFDDEFQGTAGVVRDISDRRERERELKRKTDLFEKTQRMATVGGWELDLHDDTLHLTDEIYRIFELPLDYDLELESALEFFHTEDTHIIEDAVERAIEDGESYDIELRLITANDDLRWVRALGEPRQENGETVMLRGALQDITEQKRHMQALEEAEGRFRALTESAEFGVVTIDETSTIQYANDALEEVLGYGPEELEGESITNLMPERFRDDHHGGIQRYLREGTRNLDWDWLELPGLHKDGHEVPLGISFGETQLEDGSLFTGILRDITERSERENQIESLHEASRQLTYANTPEKVASVTVEIASQVLDKPLSMMWFHDEETDQLVSAATTDSTREFLDAADVTELPSIGEGRLGMDVFRDGEMAVIEDYDTIENPAFPNLPLGTVIIVPIGNHGILELGAESIDEITDTDRHQINILALNAQAALDRAQREQALTQRKEMIESLHGATRDMVGLADVEDICELAVDAAREILDIPNTAIWISDDTEPRLKPIAQSTESAALVDELPVYTPDDESFSWQAFESGETGVYDDLRTEAGVANPETPMRSEIIIPLGEYGVMNFASQTSYSFDETDVRVAELVGAGAVTALERADREQKLETQLDRMEFFNSILRHDVLNGMTVIQGRAEFLADELDGDQLRDAEAILDWSDDIIEIVQRVRTTLNTLTGEGDIPLEPVELTETLQEELERVRETYPEVAFETTILDSVRVQGNELLSEVLGNIITNAVDHNETEGLCISLTAAERKKDDSAVVRIEDNGKGVADEFKETIFRREKTGHAKSSGSGFGLFFVDTMVDNYGGDVQVEDNDAGGATFVIELPLADAITPA